MNISLSEADIAGLIRSPVFAQAVREAFAREQACVAAVEAQRNYIEGIVNNIFAAKSTLDSFIIDAVIERLKKEADMSAALRTAAREVVDSPAVRKKLVERSIYELEEQIARLRSMEDD